MPQSIPSGWTQAGNTLTRTIQRADFVEALAFVLEIGKLAERANHHPNIDIRYRTVHLSLSSHEAGNIVTDKDLALAREINDLSEDEIRHTKDDLRNRFSH